MLARRQKLTASVGPAPHLIFPIKIYDFELPPDIAGFQTLDVSHLVSPMITPASSNSQRLWWTMKSFADNVAAAVREAPPHDPDWLSLASSDFQHIFNRAIGVQSELPSLG
jgi:hypothetical protein